MDLEQKIPPVMVTILTVLFMYINNLYASFLNFTLPFNEQLLIIFVISGFAFAISGVVSFKKHKTTVNPINTKNVSTLVISGIYRYTRNPMYVGMLMVLLGYLLYLGNPINVLFIALFIWYMTTYQIKPEEVLLASLFGDEYDLYKTNVRRWL